MDKVMEKLEPIVKKIDDAIAKYPSVTQYGMSRPASPWTDV